MAGLSRDAKGAPPAPTVRGVQIVATGMCLPARCVRSAELDQRLGLKPGTVARKFGVQQRYWAEQESMLDMAVQAAQTTLARAGVGADQLDCLVVAGSVPAQAVPSTAALLQEALGLGHKGMLVFDLNSTCLSHITALDSVANLIHLGRCRLALVVSSERPSLGLDWTRPELCSLFGDGAAATLLQPAPAGSGACFETALMRNWAVGAQFCHVTGGGSHERAVPPGQRDPDAHLFRMDGKAAFRLTAEKLPGFLVDLLRPMDLRLADIDWVVPHQASAAGMRHMTARLKLDPNKVIQTIGDYGNQVAASVPTALHLAIESGRIQRGQRVLLLGTAAGIAIGAVLLRF